MKLREVILQNFRGYYNEARIPIDDPMWEKAFSFSLTGENAIPLNKRGSGIRRLVLFSFFRAATESELFDRKNIIYAVEEPETSQHPDA